MKSLLVNYKTESFYDEMLTPDGDVRPSYKLLLNKLEKLGIEDLKAKQHTAEKAYVSMGITFNVYHEGQGIERTLPFDLLPRIIPYEEWDIINRGLLQRVFAINAFLDDVYNKKLVLKDKVVPKEIVESSPGYLRA
ncbi:MAG: circularly permuted type 2 ATP-grasp protein, partial [Candidatus Omnitrophica bacterium]|nr:circularly permuted type 2 ATP-grasp protein [Candidatus Omnitrophota bacterium]